MNLKLDGMIMMYKTQNSKPQCSMPLPFQTSIIPCVEELDPDVLSTMNSLQCFKDKDRLIQELLNSR